MCVLADCEWSEWVGSGMGPQLDELVSCAFVYEACNCLRVCIVWQRPEPKTSLYLSKYSIFCSLTHETTLRTQLIYWLASQISWYLTVTNTSVNSRVICSFFFLILQNTMRNKLRWLVSVLNIKFPVFTVLVHWLILEIEVVPSQSCSLYN